MLYTWLIGSACPCCFGKFTVQQIRMSIAFKHFLITVGHILTCTIVITMDTGEMYQYAIVVLQKALTGTPPLIFIEFYCHVIMMARTVVLFSAA